MATIFFNKTAKVITASRLIVAPAVLCLVATVYVLVKELPNVYFVQFHKPFNVALVQHLTVDKPVTLPSFQVTASIAESEIMPGGTQSIRVTLTPGTTTHGFLEVWITSPQHKEVYKSPLDDNHPQTFTTHQTQTVTLSYKLPRQIPSGLYTVSDLITSVNQQTDYYVNENFATFKVL